MLPKPWTNKYKTVPPAIFVLFTFCTAVDNILGEKCPVKVKWVQFRGRKIERNLSQKDYINKVWEQNWALPPIARNYVLFVEYYLEMSQVFSRVPVGRELVGGLGEQEEGARPTRQISQNKTKGDRAFFLTSQDPRPLIQGQEVDILRKPRCVPPSKPLPAWWFSRTPFLHI